MAEEVLLDVRGLTTQFITDRGALTAVDGASFSIRPGRTLGLVGESGSGKSVTSLSILRLLQEPAGRIASGEVLFEGEDLTKLSEKQMRQIRGERISMIFQEPMTALNPVYTVGQQIMEVYTVRQGLKKKEARARTLEMLHTVGIPDPETRIDSYPHQLSGGMRQRVMIAMALACHPRLLIADEPTTALDVTIQAQILALMKQLQQQFGTALMLITHDLGVIDEVADDVAVMYCGQIVEYGTAEQVFDRVLHPYTQGLLASIPHLDSEVERLSAIPGMVPSLYELPAGCRFHPRCSRAMEICRREAPREVEVEPGHRCRCHLYQ